MTLSNDIDISYVAPEELFADPTHASMLTQAGITLNSRGNYVAKFRDPRRAAVLKRGVRADQKVF